MRKADKRTLLVLFALSLSTVLLLCLDVQVNSSSEPSVEQQVSISSSKNESSGRVSASRTRPAGSHLEFSPDTVSEYTLRSLGIAASKARTFVRFRAAGKQFNTLDDIRKTYGWTEQDVQRVAPHIRFTHSRLRTIAQSDRHQPPQTSVPERGRYEDSEHHSSRKFPTFTRVDVNTADTILLQRIPGIGSYYAQRIVSLRQRYGGLADVSQLKRIDRLPADALHWLMADTTQIVKIDLSHPDFKQMARHPLIGYERTKALTVFIRTNGPIRTFSQLRGTGLFTDAELEMLRPYLMLSER